MLEPLGMSPYRLKHLWKKFLIEVFDNPYFEMIDKKYIIGWPFFQELNGYTFISKYLFVNKKRYCVGDFIQVENGELVSFFDTHPNQEGHNLIFNFINKELKKFELI